MPHPRWVKVEEVSISSEHTTESARLLASQLGPDGVSQVGGTKWWQWRTGGGNLKAEWIEMRSSYDQRKQTGDKGKKIILYVHGGAYFFGSVDEHRYQLQRHARKLEARVLARYQSYPTLTGTRSRAD